jgi:CheY-like chemotaxis protein
VKSILVVEDDRGTRRLVRGLLEARHFEVCDCASAAEALDLLDRRGFDLVLADIWLPGMSGFDLIRHLGARGSATPVVFITADDTPATLLRAVRDQAHELVRKPISAEVLYRAVDAAISAPACGRPIRIVSAKPDWVELLVPCDREAARRIQSFLANLDADLPEAVRETVGLAFRELLMNAVEWGGRLDSSRDVRISYLRTRRMVLYRIADPGLGFSFDDLPHAAVANPEGEPAGHVTVREEKGMRAGGFGILMARALVDELVYNETQNDVVLVKYLD